MQLVLGRLAATQSAKPLTLSLLVDQPFFTDLVVPENFGRPGSAAGAAALKSGQGPPGRGIAEGVSLLSVGAADTWGPPKTPAFYGVLCSLHFFPFFGSCGLRWVNMGQHRPQDGPT